MWVLKAGAGCGVQTLPPQGEAQAFELPPDQVTVPGWGLWQDCVPASLTCLLSLAQRVGGARLVFNSFSEGVPYAAFPCVSGRT